MYNSILNKSLFNSKVHKIFVDLSKSALWFTLMITKNSQSFFRSALRTLRLNTRKKLSASES